MLLADRVCIVSGVGPGIGRAVAAAVGREGGIAVVAARNADYLDEVAAELTAAGGRVLAVPTDITVRADCDRLVERTLDAFGRVDVLVNNAAATSLRLTITNSDLDAWRGLLDVNLIGSLQLSQAALVPMVAQRSGSIVFVNAMIIRKVRPTYGAYAASKGALLVAAQVLAKEVGEHGIRVNSVLPGFVWAQALVDGFVRRAIEERGVTEEEVYAELASATALGVLPTPESCADPVIFLASDLARSVTGQTLDVNGGEVFA